MPLTNNNLVIAKEIITREFDKSGKIVKETKEIIYEQPYTAPYIAPYTPSYPNPIPIWTTETTIAPEIYYGTGTTTLTSPISTAGYISTSEITTSSDTDPAVVTFTSASTCGTQALDALFMSTEESSLISGG